MLVPFKDLIGQLSRNSNVSHDDLSGKQLIDFAKDVINTSVNAAGGRYMMVECRAEKNLVDFYKRNDFYILDNVPDMEEPMIQMIQKIS